MKSELATGLAVGALAAALAVPAFAQDLDRRNSDLNEQLLSPAAVVDGTDLPVTAVGEGSGQTTAEPARETDMDATAQRDQPLVDEAPDVYGSDVTVHNPDGVEAVHDSLDRDVYTGVEGAGGVDATRVAPDNDASMPR